MALLAQALEGASGLSQAAIEQAIDPADATNNTSAHRDERGRLLPGHPHAWKPGQHGGGRGRPSVEREITQAARSVSMEALAELANVMRDKKAQAVARVRAVEIILERAYGKAPQRVVVETDVAGMSNEALTRYMRAQLEAVSRTIEHDPTEGNGG